MFIEEARADNTETLGLSVENILILFNISKG